MASVVFEGGAYSLESGESVLACLTRNGHDIPNACRSGVCHSCMMRVTDGALPAGAQKGLKAQQQAQGYFLACCCQPDADLVVARADDAFARIPAILAGREPLNERVLRVLVEPRERVSYFAGQFMNFVRHDGLLRSFSLASVPGVDPLLEFHVALVPGGRMSGWLHQEADLGTALELRGPLGNCFYTPGKPDQPLFLLGTGTGLAPLYGIVRDALRQGHSAPIHLFHGGARARNLYLVETLQDLADVHPNFRYHPCLRDETGMEGTVHGPVEKTAMEAVSDLKGWKVFLCGNPDLVRQVQRKTFMAGASMSDIHADPFLPAASA